MAPFELGGRISLLHRAFQSNVYTLMKLLGHESMNTSQRYVSAAGTETRSAAATNPLYELIPPTRTEIS